MKITESKYKVNLNVSTRVGSLKRTINVLAENGNKAKEFAEIEFLKSYAENGGLIIKNISRVNDFKKAWGIKIKAQVIKE